MHVYLITSPDHEPKVIFANSLDDAAEMICVWQCLNGIGHVDFTIDPRWLRRLPRHEAETLREVLNWKVDGMGTQDSNGRWCILPIRDERDET